MLVRQVPAKNMNANRGRNIVKMRGTCSVSKKFRCRGRIMRLGNIAPKWIKLISV